MDCVGKTADVIGDFASCRCSSFNMSFEVELSIKPDPKPSEVVLGEATSSMYT